MVDVSCCGLLGLECTASCFSASQSFPWEITCYSDGFFSFICDLYYFSCNFEEFFSLFCLFSVSDMLWNVSFLVLSSWHSLCLCLSVCLCFGKFSLILLKLLSWDFFPSFDYNSKICSFDGVAHFLYDSILCFKYFHFLYFFLEPLLCL